MTSTPASARTFGMKTRVCSWICVTAWKTDTIRPTMRPTPSTGSATLKASVSAVVDRLTTTSWSISGSSGESACPRAFAGAAWQGRRSRGVALPHETPRTPPGGDQRTIRGCGDLPEGPLVLALLRLPARDRDRRVRDLGRLVAVARDVDVLEPLVVVALGEVGAELRAARLL